MAAQEYCFLWIDWWPLCMDKQSWAAWVQAVGSIAAIGGAFAIVLWQQRMSNVSRHRERIQTELDAVDALGGLFLLADAMTSAAYNSAESKARVIQLFAIKDSFSRSSALVDALMNTPLSAATTPNLQLALIEGRNAFQNAVGQIVALRLQHADMSALGILEWQAQFSKFHEKVFQSACAFKDRKFELIRE